MVEIWKGGARNGYPYCEAVTFVCVRVSAGYRRERNLRIYFNCMNVLSQFYISNSLVFIKKGLSRRLT